MPGGVRHCADQPPATHVGGTVTSPTTPSISVFIHDEAINGKTNDGQHIVGHEPQPRQAAQLNRDTQTVRSAVAGHHERLIRRRQREVPEHLLPADVREPSKLVQLLVREHIARRHPAPLLSTVHRGDSTLRRIQQPTKPGSTTPGHGNQSLILCCLLPGPRSPKVSLG
jgi:hypothetical protein